METLMGKILSGKLLLRPIESESSSKIFLTDKKEEQYEGEVVLMGPFISETIEDITIGDKVIYGHYSGQKLTIDGNKYVLLSSRDVLYIK